MNRIYLIGLPGSGKSTSGKRFAKTLGWGYADLDKLVVLRAGKSIKTIFEEEGEQAFRLIEQFQLHQTISSSKIVIGCGGGTAAWFDNMDWMLTHGQVVWLNIKREELSRRLQISFHDRPMFPDRTEEAINQQLQNLWEARIAFYSRANFIVNSEAALLALAKELKQQ